jgi:hypothetical protein
MSTAVVYTNRPSWPGLNVRQLLAPLFFPQGGTRHPDMKRQSSRRQRDRDLRAARALKTAYVPLRMVDPTVYLWDRGIEKEVTLSLWDAYGSAYRRRVYKRYVEASDDEETTSPTGRLHVINEQARWDMGRNGWRRMEPR